MGQQQLLLLVLGIVIVGIAVVAGIQAFSEGKTKAARDAATSDAMRLISDIQAWKLKPTAFGGGADGNATNFAGVNNNFKSLGIAEGVSRANSYVTVNGCFMLAGTATNAVVTIYEVYAPADSVCSKRVATVTVAGTSSRDITWAY